MGLASSLGIGALLVRQEQKACLIISVLSDFYVLLLYDTNQILDRMGGDYPPASGAFDLMMDIVGLRSWVESLLRHFT